MDSIRLLLVDDHAMVRQGLHLLLGTQPDFDIVGEAPDAPTAVDLTGSLHPDVVLMDINLPGDSGIVATRAIAKLGLGTRVLGLSAHEDPAFLAEMLAAGASGYVLKGATGDELISAIRLAHIGGLYLSSGMASHLESALAYRDRDRTRPANVGLTPREEEVLGLLGKGLTYQAIAEKLDIAVNTVASHRANLMRKLAIVTKEQLMDIALGMRKL